MARQTAAEKRAAESEAARQAAATEHPVEQTDTLETATEDAPESLSYGEPRLADVGEDYTERPYADAITPEHAERLREYGQHPDQLAQ